MLEQSRRNQGLHCDLGNATVLSIARGKQIRYILQLFPDTEQASRHGRVFIAAQRILHLRSFMHLLALATLCHRFSWFSI